MTTPTSSRQETKVLEKELIMKMERVLAFVESAKEEEKSCFTFKFVGPVPDIEAEKILADLATKRRGACHHDKNKGVPPLKAKCRIVVQGHQDPDLQSISRQAPTRSTHKSFTPAHIRWVPRTHELADVLTKTSSFA